MNIVTLTLGDYRVNCYIVWEEGAKTCAVIDPGYEPETIAAKIHSLGLTVDAILLTHGHFDHVGGVEAIAKEAGCAIWMAQSDYALPKNPVTAYLYPLANRNIPGISFYANGGSIPAGGLEFTVYATPGHTKGSVCLACGDTLFTGDTLFAGSQGRTDLPGGSSKAMEDSMAFLRSLDFDGRVLPGHGPASTMAYERRTNPYL